MSFAKPVTFPITHAPDGATAQPVALWSLSRLNESIVLCRPAALGLSPGILFTDKTSSSKISVGRAATGASVVPTTIPILRFN
jgi:hypothetical protein